MIMGDGTLFLLLPFQLCFAGVSVKDIQLFTLFSENIILERDAVVVVGCLVVGGTATTFYSFNLIGFFLFQVIVLDFGVLLI